MPATRRYRSWESWLLWDHPAHGTLCSSPVTAPSPSRVWDRHLVVTPGPSRVRDEHLVPQLPAKGTKGGVSPSIHERSDSPVM